MFHPSVLLVALGLFTLSGASLRAQNYTWTGVLTAGPSSWNVDANWGGTPNPFPNAIGDIANLTADFTAAPTINLTIPITVGSLYLDDTGASGDVAITLAGGGGSLIFDMVSGSASLFSSGAANVISSGIQLNKNLNITATNSFTISGPISEGVAGMSITKFGANTLTLSGTNSYTGPTLIVSNTLNLVLNADIGVSANSVIGNAASAVQVGTTNSINNLTSTLQFTAGSDTGNYAMARGLDLAQGTNAGAISINFTGDGLNGLNTNTLTLAGDIAITNNRVAQIRSLRSGMTVNITGNIIQTGSGGNFNLNTTPSDPNADGGGNGTIRFSSLSRNFAANFNDLMGLILIDGTVGAVGTASPIGQTAVNLTQGNSGNAVGAGNFAGGVAASRDTSVSTIRGIFLDSAGSSYARIMAPGGSSASTPPTYGSQVNIPNGFQFGGKNTSGTVTFSGAITPNDFLVGSSQSNVITTAANIALIAENGGTAVFSGAISDTPDAATTARLTINQFRNHPNVDGVNTNNNQVSANNGNYDGFPDPTANQLVGTAKTGTVALSGANTIAGNIEVLGGTLQVGNSTALGFGGRQNTATGITTISNGCVLDLNGTAGINEPIILNGTGISSAGALINSSATPASIANGIAGIQLGSISTGSSYSAAPTVAFSGTGSGAAATASLGLTTASISSITSGGTGWAVGDYVNFTAAGGSGALGQVTAVSGGVVTAISVVKPGSGYTAGPTAFAKNTSTSGAGTTTLTGNTANFTVAGLTMTAAGTGYTGTPTYTFGTGNATPGTVTLSSVTLGSDSSIGGTGDITINSVISDGGGAKALTKVGAGTLTLPAANTYSGATLVNVGKLVGVVGGSLASSAVSVAATAGNTATLGVSITDNTKQWTCSSLTVNNVGTSSTLDFNFGLIAPSITVAPLKVNGAATFTTTPTVTVSLAANNIAVSGVYPLMTWGSGGASAPTAVTIVTAGHSTIAGHLTVTGGNTLNLVIDSVTSTEPLSWTGGSGTWDVNNSGNTIWKDVNNATTYYQLGDTVIFDNTVGSGGTVTLNTNVSPTGVTVNNTSAYTISGTGAIAGTTTLNKSGAGTLTISTTNTYSGDTTISGGTLKLGTSVVIPDGAGKGNVVMNPASGTATLDLGGNSETVNGLSSSGAGSSAVDNSTGASTYTLTAGANDQTSAFGGVIKNTSGTVAVTKTGTGTLTLSGANTFSGATTISAGTLKLGASDVIPDGTGKGNVVMNPASGTATLDLAGNSDTINGLNNSGAGSSVVDNSTGSSASLIVGNNDQGSFYTGVIKNTVGNLALTKVGAGQLTLSANNTFSGGITNRQNSIVLQGGAGINELGSGPFTFGNLAGGLNNTLALNIGVSKTFANNFVNDNAATITAVQYAQISYFGNGGGYRTLTFNGSFATGPNFLTGVQGFYLSPNASQVSTALGEGTMIFNGDWSGYLAGATDGNALRLNDGAIVINSPAAIMGSGVYSIEGNNATVATKLILSGAYTVANEVRFSAGFAGPGLRNSFGSRNAVGTTATVSGLVNHIDPDGANIFSQTNGATLELQNLGGTGGGAIRINDSYTLTTGDGVNSLQTPAGTVSLTKATGNNINCTNITVVNGTLLVNNTSGSGTGTNAVTVGLVGAAFSGQAGTNAASSRVIGGFTTATAQNLRIGQSISGTGLGAGAIITGITIGSGANNSTIVINNTIGAANAAITDIATTASTTTATLGGTGIIGGVVTFNPGSHAVFTNGAALTLTNSLIIATSGTIPDVHLNLPANLGAGNYTLATYNPAGSSGIFNTNPVIDSGSLAANTQATVVTSGGAVVLQVTSTFLNTTTTLVSSSNPSGYNDSVACAAAVQTNGVTAGDATGSVVFSTAISPISTNAVSGGVASTASLGNLSRGTNLITAVYSGGGIYLASTNTLLQVVTNHPPVVSGNTYTRNGVTTWKIPVANLLTNAVDADGDSLTLGSVGISTNGVSLSINGGYVLYANATTADDQFSFTVTDNLGGTNSGVITLTANVAGGNGGQVNSFTLNGGTASMTFAGIPNYLYHVQVSTNLSSWNTLWTTNAPASGVFLFNDSNAPQPDAYYRLMWNGN